MRRRTFSSSPSKRARKLAWVPVVPLTPRNRRLLRAFSRLRRSISRSWVHRQARLPTVVNWAGLQVTASLTINLVDTADSYTLSVRCYSCIQFLTDGIEEWRRIFNIEILETRVTIVHTASIQLKNCSIMLQSLLMDKLNYCPTC